MTRKGMTRKGRQHPSRYWRHFQYLHINVLCTDTTSGHTVERASLYVGPWTRLDKCHTISIDNRKVDNVQNTFSYFSWDFFNVAKDILIFTNFKIKMILSLTCMCVCKFIQNCLALTGLTLMQFSEKYFSEDYTLSAFIFWSSLKRSWKHKITAYVQYSLIIIEKREKINK